MIKVNKGSWHYWLFKQAFADEYSCPRSTSLCFYFWTVVGSFFVHTLLMLALVSCLGICLAFILNLSSDIFELPSWSTLFYVIAFVLSLGCLIFFIGWLGNNLLVPIMKYLWTTGLIQLVWLCFKGLAKLLLGWSLIPIPPHREEIVEVRGKGRLRRKKRKVVRVGWKFKNQPTWISCASSTLVVSIYLGCTVWYLGGQFWWGLIFLPTIFIGLAILCLIVLLIFLILGSIFWFSGFLISKTREISFVELVLEFLKAQKEKVCPLIEFVR